MSNEITCVHGPGHSPSIRCYDSHRCRCVRCRSEKAAYERRRRASGGYKTDPAATREHISVLVAHGWRYADIELASGVSVPTIARIMRGATKQVMVDNEAAIVGVDPERRKHATPPRLVNAVGVRRRLQALAAVGWSHTIVMGRMNRVPATAYWLMRQEHVTVETHQRVAGIYRELITQTPPQTTGAERGAFNRVRGEAARKGWHGPAAWESIDDPSDTPNADVDVDLEPDYDEVAVLNALAGIRVNLTRVDREEAVRRGHTALWADPVIAARTGISPEHVRRIRQRLNLPALEGDDILTLKDAA